MCLFAAANLLLEIRAYVTAHDENVMSSLIIHPLIIWSVEYAVKAVFH